MASYGLVGFEPPVDNDVVNVAQAGRAIPLKWRLYDRGGNWTTAKAFADTCRRLRLDLGEQKPDGTPYYRSADFR